MSVIIRLQNLPWSANALDIRNYFRGLSIPEGGVHIVGGELGDAFIAFSTDEDARQAMMLDCGKIKEIQVKLLLSSRSEMHKVIEAARQSVPVLSLAPAPAPAPAPLPLPVAPPAPAAPLLTSFSSALGAGPLAAGFGIPGLGNPQEIPQPAVIEPPAPLVSPRSKSPTEEENLEDTTERKRSKEKDRRRSRSRSRSRDRDRKDRKRDRRDRSRSRERRRRDRSRSRERRDRKRDRKDRSRSRERSPRRSRDKRGERKSPQNSQERSLDNNGDTAPPVPPAAPFVAKPNGPRMPIMNNLAQNGPPVQIDQTQPRFNDPTLAEAFNKLQELGKKRNPNAFQGEQQNGTGFRGGRGGGGVGAGAVSARVGSFRREGRPSRFDDQPRDCCVAIRNAPNHTSYGDVRRFFPVMIDKHGIKMINDSMGRRTGNIFVRFCDPRSKQLALQRKANELKGAQVTVEPLDDDTYEAAVDSFLPYRKDNDEEDPSLVIADPEEPAAKPFNVLKLSELPNFIQEHEIIKAFTEFSLLSIALSDCRMTRTKTALVQFVKPEDAKLALSRKDNYLFGRRQAVITPLTEEEYNREKSSDYAEQPPLERASKDQIPEPVMPRDPRQRRQQMDSNPMMSGGGAMSGPGQFFPSAAPFTQNFGAPFQGAQFSGYPGPGNMEPRTAAANWANRMNFPNQIDAGPMQGTMQGAMQAPMKAPVANAQQVITVDLDDEPLDCVLMKGLPREATDRTIVNFLADTGAVPARIHLMLDANGLPSGDCFCEFRSSKEARQAAGKHGRTLDGCRVTVDLVMRSVVEEALEGPKGNESNHDAMPVGGGPPQFGNAPRGGFAPRGQFRGRGGFDRGFDRGGFGRGGYDSSRGRGRGNWTERGNGRGFDRGRGRGFSRGRGGFGSDGPMPTRQDDEQDPALEDFGAPGCVVSMENVPFRATVDDILSYFGDFDLTQDDVIRRYNERGQPTGDARVAFRTPFDAQRAVKILNMNTIFDRRISLSIL
ncbi:RNA-binding protein 12 [Bicyclus anynana]|uniref:RNA-binding protein 12 n=1 Tax=Bicyclus anynana TaxID=110368 RepID=A0ABM3LJ15_BICAN|nr:RNA-binding protein 12 [Bicyclus anynana]